MRQRDERLATVEPPYPAIERRLRIIDVLADDEIDAVVLATPVATHFELASQALAVRQARLRREAARGQLRGGGRARAVVARGAAVVLMPGHTFLYSPPVVFIRS